MVYFSFYKNLGGRKCSKPSSLVLKNQLVSRTISLNKIDYLFVYSYTVTFKLITISVEYYLEKGKNAHTRVNTYNQY